MINIQVEQYTDVVDEMKTMFKDLSREVDIYPGVTEPDVDNEQFVEMGDNVLVVTVRDDDEMVGMNVTVILQDILFKHVKTAYNMFYYIKPEYRKSSTGLEMFKFTENQLRGRGVERSYMPRKIHLGGEGLFHRLGYMPIEINYTKYLGD